MEHELTQAERELLSAHVDGELTAAESRQAEALLARPEAAAYAASMQALRGLVQKHAGLRAPVGLAGRVQAALDSDFDGISRPTNKRQEGGTVHTLPTATWRMPFVAAAAALVISLGIMFGPSLFETSGERPTSIARELPRVQAPAEPMVPPPATADADKSGKSVYAVDSLKKEFNESLGKEPGTLGEDSAALRREALGGDGPASNDPAQSPPAPAPAAPATEAADEIEEARKLEAEGRAGATGGSDPAPKKDSERAREGDTGGSAGGGGGTGGMARGSSKKKNGSWDDSRNSRNDAEEKTEEKTEEKNQDGSEGDGGAKEAKATPAETKGGPGHSTEDKQGLGGVQGEPNRQPQDGDSKDGENYDRAKGVEKAPAAPALGGAKPEEQNEDNSEAETADSATADASGNVTVTLDTAMQLAAQAEILRVGALYGKALLDQDDETESVVIELPEAQLPELLGALKRLAGEQQFGTLQIPEGVKAEPAAAGAGYLPGALRPGAGRTQPADAPKPGRVVKLRVCLQ